MPHTSHVTNELVVTYVRKAKSIAKSELERAVVEAAASLADKRPIEILAEADQSEKRAFRKVSPE